jgi:hypothetical protein
VTTTQVRDVPLLSVQDEVYEQLHRAGWTLGIYSLADRHGVVCMVEGVNGENMIPGKGDTLEAANLSACDLARAVGMLGRQQERQADRRR